MPPRKKTTGNNAKAISSHAVKEKLRRNALAPINKLPIELFKRIIRLTSPAPQCKHRYISYTWVCHHWRSVIIQSTDLWTSIHISFGKERTDSIIPELLRRSASANLDVGIRINSDTPMLQDFLTNERNRIQTLRLEAYNPKLTEKIFAGKHFPSLKRVAYYDSSYEDSKTSAFGLLPVISDSDHLHTLKCGLWRGIPPGAINQLAPVLSRTQSHLKIKSHYLLQTLELQFSHPTPFTFSKQVIFPELQYFTTDNVSLLDGIWAPKLSSLDIKCSDSEDVIFKNPSVLQEFGSSSIRYLHILDQLNGGHTILGLKEPIHPKSTFSIKSKYYDEVSNFIDEVDEMVSVDDYLSDPWTRDYVRINFMVYDDDDNHTLKPPLYSILPQLTGLVELCLASDTLYQDGIRFDEILAKVPSIEVLIILHNDSEDGLLKFIPHLGNTSLCPRLKHLSYMSNETGRQKMADRVGRLLTKSLKSRHKVYGSVLNHIILGHCPPLPRNWLDEMQKIGTMVVTKQGRIKPESYDRRSVESSTEFSVDE